MTRFDNGSGDSGDASDPFAGVPDIDERLADWVDGTMKARDRERFEAEMRVSPPLRKQVEEYEQTVSSIQMALRAETQEIDLADRVMAGLAQEATGAVRPTRSMMPYILATTCAAALLGVAVMIDSWGGATGRPSDEDRVAAESTSDALRAGSGAQLAGAERASGNADGDQQAYKDMQAGEQAGVKDDPADKAGHLAALNKSRADLTPTKNQPGSTSDDSLRAKKADGRSPETKATGQRKQSVVGAPTRETDTGSLKPVPPASGDPVASTPTLEQGRPHDRTELGTPDGNKAANRSPNNAAPNSPTTRARRAGPGGAVGPATGGPVAGGPGTSGPAGPVGGGSTGSAARARGGRRSPGAPAPSALPGTESKALGKPEGSSRELSNDEKQPGKDVDPIADDRREELSPTKQGELARHRVRFAREGADAEVLPLITIEGLTVAFEIAKDQAAENAEGQNVPTQSADDFYLGTVRGLQRAQMTQFFKSQMRARDEWLAPRQATGQEEPAREMSEKFAAENDQSLGGLRLFSVGPMEELDRSNQKMRVGGKPVDQDAKAPTLGSGARQLPVPGKKEAKGHDYVQRDWLVVGPQSEVSKLLEELRRYAAAGKNEWRSGEAQVAMQDRTRSRSRAGLVNGAPAPKPAETPPPTESLKPTPQPAEKTGAGRAAALPGAKPEPVQRVVIRFRVRR